MYILIATIDGSRSEQGEYSQLNHVFSRIKQLEQNEGDDEAGYIAEHRITEFEIIKKD